MKGTEGESIGPDWQERKPAFVIREQGQKDSLKSGLHPYLGVGDIREQIRLFSQL